MNVWAKVLNILAVNNKRPFSGRFLNIQNRKKFRKFSSFISICLTLFLILGNFSLPALAYEKGNINFEQIKAETKLDNSGTILNKTNSTAKPVSGLSQNSSIIQKGKTGLEKTEQIEVKKKDYVDGEILVKYKNNKIDLNTSSGRATALNFINSKSLEKKEDLRKNNISVLRIKDTKTVEQKVAELKSDPNVEYAQPNFQYYTTVINTNDTNRGLLWGLDNTGQSVNGVSGTSNADIDAPEAWAISEATTSAPVIVAVIDGGVAYNHPDLIANMWDGVNCKDENGNALGGCNHGYDYQDNDKTPLPTDNSHGTHIAGIIAAVKNNSKGTIGVAPQAKIMVIKTSLTTADNVKSINFAKQNGAKIINASWAGPNFDQALKDAIEAFPGIFVAGAGNCGDVSTFSLCGCTSQNQILYPASYDSSNIISVAATDQNDTLATFSNYGTTSVDVGAPGTNIYSTVPSITDSIPLNESFSSVAEGSIPSGWAQNGAWGVLDMTPYWGSSWGKVLYSDLNYPYFNNANTITTAPTMNLGGATSGFIDFWTVCDTEYIINGWADYMQLEYSADGVNFSVPPDPFYGDLGDGFRWDEPTLDVFSGENPLNSAGNSVFHYKNIPIPNQYLTSNFKLRFRWVTNASDNSYNGCVVDDVKVIKRFVSNGSDEQYGYMDGTSMATPYVAGLVALIEGYNPNLTTSQVKNTILTTGDSLASLSGKTVSGKRINAFNALNSLVPVNHTISGTVKYYDGAKIIPGAIVTLSDSGTNAVVATTTTSATGTYQFANVLGEKDYTLSLTSSDTSTKGLSGADQGKIGRHWLNLELFDSIYKIISGDVDESGGLSGADQGKIGRFWLGFDSSLPSKTWKFYSSDLIPTLSNYLISGFTRSIVNITTDINNQDFVGIKMGDVDNSWVSN